jgi:Fic family protein
MNAGETLRKIDELREASEQLSNIKEAEERKKEFWRKFRLEFNYNSNHIEGNTLTYGHTELLLIRGKVTGDYDVREVEEMKAHDTALAVIRDEAKSGKHQLSEMFIRQLNEIILVEPYYNEAITPSGQPTRRLITPGQYKQMPNSVLLANGEMFEYAKPEETPALMHELVQWYRDEESKTELHPVQLAALLHYRFVRIHPFDDSNGRTSRLLMNYVLIKKGYAPLVIESDDKKNYLAALSRADTGELNAFIEYIVQKSAKWQGLYLYALEGKDISEESDIDKQIELVKKQLNTPNKSEQLRSSTTIKLLCLESIFPLLKQIEDRCVKLNDLFISNARTITCRHAGIQFNLISANENLGQVAYNLQKFEVDNPNAQIDNLFYSYDFKGFKKSDSAQSCSVQASFDFGQFNCLMRLGGIDFTLPYGRQLDNSVSKKLVDTVIGNLLESIRQFSKY